MRKSTIKDRILSLQVTYWEIVNFVSGYFLAKISSVVVIKNIENPTIKYLNGSIVEFVFPLVLIGGVIIGVLFSKMKKVNGDDFILKEKYEYAIDALVCAVFGVIFFLFSILLINSILTDVKQAERMIYGILPYEWSLAITLSLISSCMVHFHHTFKNKFR